MLFLMASWKLHKSSQLDFRFANFNICIIRALFSPIAENTKIQPSIRTIFSFTGTGHFRRPILEINNSGMNLYEILNAAQSLLGNKMFLILANRRNNN